MKIYPATLDLYPGQHILLDGRRMILDSVIDMNTILVCDYETGKCQPCKINDVKPVPSITESSLEIVELSTEELRLAEERYKAIEPLIDLIGRTKAIVCERALEVGVDVVTLYRWLRLYSDSRLLSSLVNTRRADKGKSRLEDNVEEIIADIIDKDFLTDQKIKVSHVYQRVKEECFNAGVEPPHLNTVRNRVKTIPHQKKVAKRQGRKKAENKYSGIKGHFPGADFPLAVVQIDHTPLDIILVDDAHRLPLSRPWITLAMDVFSRMVVGFYISLEKPCTTSVGMCICNSILKKDRFLSHLNIEADWPCSGLPRTIHVDNAKEFRGEVLRLACKQYKIDIEWRPVGRPNFGAHVERLLGTFATEIHTLPGTTFSNLQEKGEYKSEEKAVFTFSEFCEWLTTYITKVYHQNIHSTIGMTPIEKFKRGILGDDSGNQIGRGLPSIVLDEDKLRLDFMPMFRRTIQRYGVAIDNIYYWHDVLRPWVESLDPDNPNAKRKFVFRRDPRDISQIWFYDPQLKEYYSIPYRDTSYPPMSIWELKKIKEALKKSGKKKFDERAIFEAYKEMREIEEKAAAKTKSARRANQRRSINLGAASKLSEDVSQNRKPQYSSFEELDYNNIEPFDEMEYIEDRDE
ncbi:transposase [Maridesulfovibrio sp.]|uniref:transposase n=1 Tax=Maridesulfovibrio sp. TaxID=2795000 RepID=UPI0039F118D1